MPKRGSSTSGTVAAIPRKKQKNTEPIAQNDSDEPDENIPMEQPYSSQALKRVPEVTLCLIATDQCIAFFLAP